ncbi:hypothetical protein SEA_SEPHIROTH_137 [Gordonia Phage Sephiroth]|uniref:Uncharacterized protein n=2 Tax=Octobienvirus TaxID=3044779 RepID=A0AAE8Y6R0_9CAUD|nr:hypothetical protein L3Y23_gp094 [Gordonia Phage Sephiroth]YP_010246659.1 hypothetical protein L3Y24_gp097 [Gordonia phage Kudefre]QNN99471.1 hypothetical protein SEA_SEPHIROTH_137 [Gordonia Phage Sephiroth]UDL15359.1 hypothetical protein SEA_KUDEFRE_146 [Gordonia phage Kudefre]
MSIATTTPAVILAKRVRHSEDTMTVSGYTLGLHPTANLMALYGAWGAGATGAAGKHRRGATAWG